LIERFIDLGRIENFFFKKKKMKKKKKERIMVNNKEIGVTFICVLFSEHDPEKQKRGRRSNLGGGAPYVTLYMCGI